MPAPVTFEHDFQLSLKGVRLQSNGEPGARIIVLYSILAAVWMGTIGTLCVACPKVAASVYGASALYAGARQAVLKIVHR